MLPKGLEKPYTEFYQAVFADGVVEGVAGFAPCGGTERVLS